MDLGLTDKVALVTGGASGIGEAVVRQLHTEGAMVVIADRDESRGTALVAELTSQGAAVRFYPIDLTNERAVGELTGFVEMELGGLDVLINSAAVNDRAGINDGVGAFRKSLETNLISVFSVTSACAALLRRRSGTIVNIGSKVAATGQGGTSGYAASKGGVHALTREWAIDFLPDGIRVNLVAPAEVWTPMYQRWLESDPNDAADAKREVEQRIPLGRRMTTPEEVADMVVFLSSDRASHITGQIIYVDGGYTHLDRAL